MGNIYCSSDWHGNLTIANKVLDEFLQLDDILYFLGDCADRGKHGVELAQKLLSDPRVKFIKGNHELFLEEGIDDMIGVGYPRNENLWISNGGYPTITGLSKMSDNELRILRAKISRLPQTLIYRNRKGKDIILNHCGYTPDFMENNEFFYPALYEPYWDRSHFFELWDDVHFPDVYVIHGHTPVCYIEKGFNDWKGIKTPQVDQYDFKAYHYCDNHKICIDLATFCTNKTVLINLDTFEEIYIKGE